MKLLLLIILFSSFSFADDRFPYVVRNGVDSAVISDQNGDRILTVEVAYGGCDPSVFEPMIDLELVSAKEYYSRDDLDSNPGLRQVIQATVRAVVKERKVPTLYCAIENTLSVTASLKEIFKKKASSFGIDLAKSEVAVTVELPKVIIGMSL